MNEDTLFYGLRNSTSNASLDWIRVEVSRLPKPVMLVKCASLHCGALIDTSVTHGRRYCEFCRRKMVEAR